MKSVKQSLLVVNLVLVNPAWVLSEPLVVQSCDRVIVQVDDPHQNELAHSLNTLACRHSRRLEKLFQTRYTIRIRVLYDMQAFRRSVFRAWYIAAVVKDDWILMQPARSLQKLDNLEGTLVHEMAHLYIRLRAKKRCPRWLDEGLAQVVAGRLHSSERVDSVGELERLESRLTQADVSFEKRKQDYAKARALVIKILQVVSLEQLISLLPKLPDGGCALSLSIADHTLREILFEKG